MLKFPAQQRVAGLGDHFFVKTRIEMIQEFGERFTCLPAILEIFLVMMAPKPFGNIGGHGSRSTNHLIGKPEALLRGQSFGRSHEIFVKFTSQPTTLKLHKRF